LRYHSNRLANIGYIQVVRHCNHYCGFCSNPTTPYTHDFESMKVLVDDLVTRGYFGAILTGGEPSLHPELPRICAYARSQGLHVRMITNGHRLADDRFAKDMAEAGLQLVHVSIYSVHPDVEERLRGTPGTLERAYDAIAAAHRHGIEVNVNCVINRHNAGHLDLNVKALTERFPFIRHFVWNNLDPSMGRAEINQAEFTPRLADFELSLARAMRFLHKSGRSFRVEKVPLCYMADFPETSTETRKIVKGEERVVHFLDQKQTVRQRDWEHIYAESCAVCTVRNICGGLFDRGNGYDPAELAPLFIDQDTVVRAILEDPSDPSYRERYASLDAWKTDFAARLEETRERAKERAAHGDLDMPPPHLREPDAPPVGRVTDRGVRLYEAAKRRDRKSAS
jgi:MoaA/NifB/PqqE/SkfB family radical SAM enzyme